jgi:hypothetical protein
MQRPTNSRRRSLLASAIWLVALVVLCLALPARNTPARTEAGAPRIPAESLAPGQGPVYSIVLPYDEKLHVPSGPNREQFAALCRLCHSPRFVLSQPPLTEKKWTEVVHKMVAVYGAPVPADQERDIVNYLMAVRGAERTAGASR